MYKPFLLMNISFIFKINAQISDLDFQLFPFELQKIHVFYYY